MKEYMLSALTGDYSLVAEELEKELNKDKK